MSLCGSTPRSNLSQATRLLPFARKDSGANSITLSYEAAAATGVGIDRDMKSNSIDDSNAELRPSVWVRLCGVHAADFVNPEPAKESVFRKIGASVADYIWGEIQGLPALKASPNPELDETDVTPSQWERGRG